MFKLDGSPLPSIPPAFGSHLHHLARSDRETSLFLLGGLLWWWGGAFLPQERTWVYWGGEGLEGKGPWGDVWLCRIPSCVRCSSYPDGCNLDRLALED